VDARLVASAAHFQVVLKVLITFSLRLTIPYEPLNLQLKIADTAYGVVSAPQLLRVSSRGDFMSGKRIILLSDGTGNSASKVWKSNVWRVFESLDLRGSEQVAFYDDGVGTSSFKPLAILGGVFGWGLKRNVLDIYKFLCLNYEEGDQIFAFGFSRGAFTIRVLIGLVLSQKLVPGATDAEVYRNAKLAYRAYRRENFHTILRIETFFRWIRDIVLYVFGARYDTDKNTEVKEIQFLGLWDTVAAYGLPVDEMARGVSQWIWPLELPNRRFDTRIKRACHALSLDDERTTFHPVLWNEKGVSPDVLTQVWFAGVHANVGGGYPDDSLAYIPLCWIMTEAQSRGLAFKTKPNKPDDPDPDVMVHARWRRDKDGRLYDSRNGLGGYYRYGPRKIEDLNHMRFSRREHDFVDNETTNIHETAIQRAIGGAHRYAPIGIPDSYQVISEAGICPQSDYETADRAKERSVAQHFIWNQVWRRRLIYFITVFASIYLALYPLVVTTDTSGEFETRLHLVSTAIRALNAFLPGALSLWIEAYARDPSHFVVLGCLVVLLIWLGVQLGTKIEERMERIWRRSAWARMSNLEIVIRILGAAGVLFAIFHDYLPKNWPGQQFVDGLINDWVKGILVSVLVALFLPPFFVQHLRSWWLYRKSVRGLRLYILPLFFAVSFAIIACLLTNHLAFSIRDSFGYVCEESGVNEGVAACVAASVAVCGPQDTVPSCSDRRAVTCGEGTAVCEARVNRDCDPNHRSDCSYRVPVCHVAVPGAPGAAPAAKASGFAICPSACEVRPNANDAALKHPDNVLNISSVCKPTGIMVEQGLKYQIKVNAPEPKSASPWKNGNAVVSTRGPDPTTLTFADRLRQVLYWPLKRQLFVQPFKVIARVGSTGSDETVLEPDDDKRTNNLDFMITPKRDGELFIYVNDSIWAFDSQKNGSNFYKDNSGQATIEVRQIN
jgi:uncharacterized protein (DUF2235 family)